MGMDGALALIPLGEQVNSRGYCGYRLMKQQLVGITLRSAWILGQLHGFLASRIGLGVVAVFLQSACKQEIAEIGWTKLHPAGICLDRGFKVSGPLGHYS